MLWSIRVVGFPLMKRTKDPESLLTVSLIIPVVKKLHTALKRGNSVGTSASSETFYREERFRRFSALHRFPGVPA